MRVSAGWCRMMGLVTVLASMSLSSGVSAFDYDRAAVDSVATVIPDRIVLTWNGDPATSAAVTWRTNTQIVASEAEIAKAVGSPNFRLYATRTGASMERFEAAGYAFHSHTVTFENLDPATQYAYRVGSGEIWSEWFHFRTAHAGPAPFTFAYFGDAQNNLLSLWSRTIRAAYAEAPKADFFLHAGDLVNVGDRDSEWSEWFEAGDFIHATIPVIATPGNHEYPKQKDGSRRLSNKWRYTFAFPENGPENLSETVYYIDYHDARIISLNSNEERGDQVDWLEDVLESNTKTWTFVTFHHPIYSTKVGRDNTKLRALWKPILDEYEVDLVLQGHDHTYGRGANVATGRKMRDGEVGPMYVVSVSGPKMYELTEREWFDRGAENSQLYQVIHVDGNKLEYQAYLATGELYDAFDLIKQDGRSNRLVDRTPKTPRRRDDNTLDKPKKK
ncbi:MAG: metallophosphoesterase [Gemmatimonadetes bacterium]|nr:metallophosphoesterase [Gemmatimonadota bacterium]